MKRLAAGWILLVFLAACPKDIGEALKNYGYTPVRPASSLWRPGSVVYLKSRRPLEVGFICTASQMMGPTYAPLESTSSNADIQRASKSGFRLGAQFQDIVSGDTELENLKSLTMTVRNVHLYEVTDYDIMTAAKTPNKRCLAAIARRRAQGYDVTIISGAIMADVAYEMRWKRSSKMDVQAKIAAAQNLSAKLGVDATSVSDKTIQATSLIWGIRADDFLAGVLAPDILPTAKRGSRLINAADVDEVEALAIGTEPRSMPTTPMSEQPPMIWAPLPALPVSQQPVVDPTELAASVSGDTNGLAVQPPQITVVPVDTPVTPDADPPPETEHGADVNAMSDAEWEAYLVSQGFDPNDTVAWDGATDDAAH